MNEQFSLPKFRKKERVKIVASAKIGTVEFVSLEKGHYYYMVEGVPYRQEELLPV